MQVVRWFIVGTLACSFGRLAWLKIDEIILTGCKIQSIAKFVITVLDVDSYILAFIGYNIIMGL